MKSAASTKSPPNTHIDGGDDEPNLFFRAMCKAAGITRKELVYDLRVSKALVDMWFTGDRNDPFKQARNAVAVFLGRRHADLLPAILIYIAGADVFDDVVLERVQQALKVQP
jgi:transcriptional regulator with XRE-family HTH domain